MSDAKQSPVPSHSDAFPPNDWLGYGIDFTAFKPGEVNTIISSVIRNVRVIKLDNQIQKRDVNGVSFKVPNNVDLMETSQSRSTYVLYEDGETAIRALQADASLADTLLPISGAFKFPSGIFQKDRQYALFGRVHSYFDAQFAGYGEWIDGTGLKAHLANLPVFDGGKKPVVAAYRNLFRMLGTHIISGTTYGSRFTLNISAPNTTQPFTDSFGQDVAAACQGIPTEGRFDSSIMSQSQYKVFSKRSHISSKCVGGDEDLAGTLENDLENPNIYNTYTDWISTTPKKFAVTSFQLIQLSDLLSVTIDPDLSGKASDVQRAFEWISEHPLVHWTKCSLSVTSDWGEIVILTPGAYFQEYSDIPENASIGTTRVFCGESESGKPPPHARTVVEFIIVNDGGPVDVSLSHGYDGTKRGNGSCTVTIQEKRYINDSITDGDWNAVSFYKCPVNPQIRGDLE